MLQPVERIGEALVAYGLGDFLGTALPRQPWPGRIGAILAVDVSADAGTRGADRRLSAPSLPADAAGDHERLVPVEALEGALDKTLRTVSLRFLVTGIDGHS